MLRFVFSLDDMDKVPALTQHQLLRRNLGCIQMLTQIISFNLNDVEEETKFIWTKAGFQLTNKHDILDYLKEPFSFKRFSNSSQLKSCVNRMTCLG